MFGNKDHHNAVPESRLRFLRSLPIFATLTDEQLAAIDTQMDETFLAAGQIAMAEGRSAREAIIIVEGEAEVLRGDTLIGHVGPGDLVGEMALIEDSERSATVRAISPMHILVFNPPQFAALLKEPAMAQWITAQMSRRLRQTNDVASASPATVATTNPLDVDSVGDDALNS